MKDYLAVSLTAVLLAACNPSSSELPLKHTRDDKTFTMNVEIVADSQIEQKCSDLGVKYEANGCAAFDTVTKVCTIYVMGQRFQQDDDRLIIIGHETWHCRYGQWHD
jgi:hypothetical protein